MKVPSIAPAQRGRPQSPEAFHDLAQFLASRKFNYLREQNSLQHIDGIMGDGHSGSLSDDERQG